MDKEGFVFPFQKVEENEVEEEALVGVGRDRGNGGRKVRVEICPDSGNEE